MFRAVTAGLNPIRSDVVLAVKEAKTATLALLKDKYHTLCAADHIKTPFRDLRAKAVRARKAPSFRASFTPSRLQNSSKNSLVHLVVQARLRITDTSSFMRAPTTLMSSPSHIQKRHLHSSSPLILSPQTSPKETQDTLEDASDKSDTTKNTKSTESQVYQKLHVPKTDMQWFIFFHNVLQGSSLTLEGNAISDTILNEVITDQIENETLNRVLFSSCSSLGSQQALDLVTSFTNLTKFVYPRYRVAIFDAYQYSSGVSEQIPISSITIKSIPPVKADSKKEKAITVSYTQNNPVTSQNLIKELSWLNESNQLRNFDLTLHLLTPQFSSDGLELMASLLSDTNDKYEITFNFGDDLRRDQSRSSNLILRTSKTKSPELYNRGFPCQT